MNHSMLIVDDSPPMHKLVRANVESSSLEIESVYDGESAVAKALEMNPSVILLDVDMPQIDGFEVCRRLKAQAATAKIPVIFLTSDAVLNDKVKGLDLGAMDYITKPFQPDELRARLKSALRSRTRLQQGAMVDNLTGLWNSTYLEPNLKAQLALARRKNQPLACMMGDIDGLGKINQLHGQGIGDGILKDVAQICQDHGRIEDAVCYLGNGRFISLLGGTTRAGAAHLADRVRIEIEKQFKHRGGIALNLTCSFGVADNQSDTDASLLERADVALYRAKQTGGNKVSISCPTTG